jgi:succinate dehydrogenase/fumarate reductase flavoprotein subunit
MPEFLNCDLVVLGGGMAGMTAAARAARVSARVIVVEKAPEIGG